MASSYHVELRDFPRASTRFNQTGEQVGAIVIPWVQDKVFELDGEKWAPYDSTITIIEGPPIPVEQLSMGRGWSAAQRQGSDVTERVLSEARAAVADGSAFRRAPGAEQAAEAPPGAAAPGVVSPPSPQAAGVREAPPAEDYPSLAGNAAAATQAEPPLPAELAGPLGAGGAPLLAAWQRVAARTEGLAPSESLALAERELQRESRPRD